MKNNKLTRDNYTVIEFSYRKIKLTQSSFRKQAFISGLFVCENIEDSEYELTNALEKLIKTNHLKITDLLISLDRSLVTVRLIKLPSVNEEEISNMAKWQAAKLLPYKIDEMVVSCQTIKLEENSFSYVLLVIVPKNIIRKFIDICDALKLQPKAIALSSEGLSNWYIQLQSHTTTDQALALVDIERDRTELVILYQDKFIFSRSFTFNQPIGEDQVKKKIIDEVKLSVESYQKQEVSEPIKKIVLTGDANWISDLSALFRNEFNLEVEVIDALKNLNLKKDLDKPTIVNNISFASICGFALSKGAPGINLLPEEAKDKVLYLEKKKELFKTVSLALAVIFIFLSVFGWDLYNKKKIINALDKQLEKLNPMASGIQGIKNKIAIINAQLSDENTCVEILREIYRITPQDIYLNTFIFQESGEVTLKGTAPTMSVVFNFVPILNESAFFENIQVRYATQRKTPSGELTDFEIICKLSSNTKDK